MTKRLKELRKYLNLNQTEFAQRIGMPQTTYSQLETGTTQISEKYIRLICLAFGVNEQWLKQGEGEMLYRGFSDLEALAPDEKQLMMVYRSLLPDTQDEIRKIADNMYELQELRKKSLNEDETDLNLNNILRLPG